MTLLQRAMRLFSSTHYADIGYVEHLQLEDIIASISNSSNKWNTAATSLAADYERTPGKRVRTIGCLKPQDALNVQQPKLSTLEWNTLALARIHRETETEESSDPVLQEDAAR